MHKRRVLAAVLAGGRGSRLGGAKATAPLGGLPMAAHAVQAAQGAGLPVVLVVKRSTALPALEVDVVREPERPSHPLCGLLAALRHAGAEGREAVLALACDMPFLPAPMLAWLAGLDGAVLVESKTRRQPLPARIPVDALPELQSALALQQPLGTALGALRPRLVAEQELARFGEPRWLFFNVNEPADVQLAERHLAESPA